jgi:beta-xylosidase
MKRIFLILSLVILLLTGCGQTTEAPPTQEPMDIKGSLTDTPKLAVTQVPLTDTPESTSTSIPLTDTPEPTVTPEPPTPTPLPEGVLFRDDFSGDLQPGWTWINEDKEHWSFVENGWLEIVGGDKAFYMEGDYGMLNFLTRDVPAGEFMISTHIQSNPNENFQQAAIYIFENQDNYIALNIGYCGPCKVGGPGFFMETFIDNNPFQNAYMVKRSPDATDVYLRLVNRGGSVTGYYATEPENWQKIGAFGNYFDFKFVGLGTTNSNGEGVANDIISRFDYFEISQP